MAVTLTQQPSGVVTLDEGICYCFVMDDIGDDLVSKELAWQLCIDGEPVTDIIIQKPKASGVPIYVDPIKMVENRLRTTIPSLSMTPIQTDDTFKAEVQIKYGEAIFDFEECENNVAEVGSQSNTVTVINTYCQIWNSQSFVVESFPLSTMPEYTTQCEGTYDWIWLCNSTITIEKIFNGGNTETTSYTASGAQYVAVGSGNVEILMSGLPGQSPRDNLSCIKIYGTGQFGTQLLSTINIIPCCCDDDCRVDLYFLDAKGSWRAVGGFKCVDSRKTNFTGTVICKEMPCNVSYDVALREYGNTFLRKEGFTNVTFKQKLRITCKNKEFYEAFGASGHYLIRIGGTPSLMRFIATTRDIPTFTDNDLTEITFSGFYNHEYRGHRIS